MLDWSVDHPEVVCEWLGSSLVFPFLSYSAFLLQLSRPLLRALRRRNCCSSLLQPCKATRRSLTSPSPAPPVASPAPTTNPALLSSKRSPLARAVPTLASPPVLVANSPI